MLYIRMKDMGDDVIMINEYLQDKSLAHLLQPCQGHSEKRLPTGC